MSKEFEDEIKNRSAFEAIAIVVIKPCDEEFDFPKKIYKNSFQQSYSIRALNFKKSDTEKVIQQAKEKAIGGLLEFVRSKKE